MLDRDRCSQHSVGADLTRQALELGVADGGGGPRRVHHAVSSVCHLQYHGTLNVAYFRIHRFSDSTHRAQGSTGADCTHPLVGITTPVRFVRIHSLRIVV